jgi:hypothetical protein
MGRPEPEHPGTRSALGSTAGIQRQRITGDVVRLAERDEQHRGCDFDRPREGARHKPSPGRSRKSLLLYPPLP